MSHFKNNTWIIPLAAFLCHQLLQKVVQVNIPIMDDYLDPFCLGALGLYGVQLERRWFFGMSKLSKLEVVFITIFLALVSEVVFPYLSDKFVRDWRDVICICLGAGWYVITEKERNGTIQKSI